MKQWQAVTQNIIIPRPCHDRIRKGKINKLSHRWNHYYTYTRVSRCSSRPENLLCRARADPIFFMSTLFPSLSFSCFGIPCRECAVRSKLEVSRSLVVPNSRACGSPRMCARWIFAPSASSLSLLSILFFFPPLPVVALTNWRLISEQGDPALPGWI